MIVLSFLVQYQLRIRAFRLISADQDEVHVGEDSEAAVAAEFAFELGAEVGGAVVQEFDLRAARERVGEVDEASDERAEGLDLRHALNVEIVYLIDQFLLECFEFAVVAQFLVALPVVEGGQYLPHVSAGLVLGEVLVHHVADADIDQAVHVVVGVGSVGVAPFAVVLVGGAVLVIAYDRIVHGHAAALADQLLRGAEERVDRDLVELREEL